MAQGRAIYGIVSARVSSDSRATNSTAEATLGDPAESSGGWQRAHQASLLIVQGFALTTHPHRADMAFPPPSTSATRSPGETATLQRYARAAGIAMLLTIIFGALGEMYLPGKIVVSRQSRHRY